MTSEQEQALQEHIQAIAKILYEDTPAEELKTLAGIEQAVRAQMQKYVMPEVGIFLSPPPQEPLSGATVVSKAFSETFS